MPYKETRRVDLTTDYLLISLNAVWINFFYHMAMTYCQVLI